MENLIRDSNIEPVNQNLQKDQHQDLNLQKDQHQDLNLQKDQHQDLNLQKDQHQDLNLQKDQHQDPNLQNQRRIYKPDITIMNTNLKYLIVDRDVLLYLVLRSIPFVKRTVLLITKKSAR